MTNEQLVANMRSSGVIKTPRVIEAFEKIDRADFVPKEKIAEAYEDHPLPIGHEATISQPSTVAFMLELLAPKRGDKILDIGSGSGWTTALLSHITGKDGEVRGVEIAPELVNMGKQNLKKYSFKNAQIMQAKKGIIGLLDEAPYDKILVSAAARDLPEELFHQLKKPGRIVIPIRSSVWKFDKVSDEIIKKQEFFGFSFVPLKDVRF